MNIKLGSKIIGYATDLNIRENGACGGFVTALLVAALKGKLVESVVVFKKINEFEAVPIVTNSIEAVIASAGSIHSVPINMARYIKYSSEKKVAITTKPCDAKAVFEQAKRGMGNIENTYLIGLNCGGSMHPITTKKMLIEAYNINPDEVEREEIDKGKLIFKTVDGKEKAISIHDLEYAGFGRRDCCRYCNTKIPINADIACGNWGVINGSHSSTFCEIISKKGVKLINNAIIMGMVKIEPAQNKGVSIREKINNSMLKLGKIYDENNFPDTSSNENINQRIKDFTVLANCIKCEACRVVCPICAYCDKVGHKCTIPNLFDDDYKLSNYHLTRLLHISNSCIGCGQCTDVCPSDIPIDAIQKRFSNPIQKKLNYIPGNTRFVPQLLNVKVK